MTLNEIETLLTKSPKEIFGADIDAEERRLLAACHPDLHGGDDRAAELFDWKVEQVIGCTRAYMTRHGYGPLPNEEPHTLKDEGNPDNEWQKQIRFAPLDMPLLRHAVANVGCELSGLSVSCLDQFMEFNMVCLSRGDLWGTAASSTKVRCDHPEEALVYLRELAPVKITANGPTWEHRTEPKP